MSRFQVQKYSVSPQINDNTKKKETSRTAEEPGGDRNKLLSLKCIMKFAFMCLKSLDVNHLELRAKSS